MKPDRTLELLSRENPVREEEMPSPQDSQARALRERILLDDGAQAPSRDSRKTPSRRIGLRVAAVGVCTAVIALGALTLIPGDDLLPGGGQTSATAVERAAAALQAPEDTILHTLAVVTQAGPDGFSGRTRIEEWRQTVPPYDSRTTVDHGGQLFESGSADGGIEFYDPRRNTINFQRLPEPPAATELPPASELPSGGPSLEPHSLTESGGGGLEQPILDLLESGQARDDGRVTVDGRKAIRIVSTNSKDTLLVDADTYEPIEWRTVFVAGVHEPVTETMRFQTYEWLPATNANRDLLSLRAQHPDARIVRGGIAAAGVFGPSR